ncbi:hypothetical protein O181_067080 [Austropuccinia psidii MF-1]|uniref:Uncharacterized protein n=1 Tax=Austropuccinia psidii MF-1 TaxID=1389203 RepID=A0A9Q3I5Q7_9BASI|nr:hypothetical protein [Austropuccinia psidii MF-1]
MEADSSFGRIGELPKGCCPPIGPTPSSDHLIPFFGFPTKPLSFILSLCNKLEYILEEASVSFLGPRASPLEDISLFSSSKTLAEAPTPSAFPP